MTCPQCGSNNYVCKGIRKIQRYKCNDCGKWFCEATGELYYRCRFPPFTIFFAVMLCIVLRSSLVSLFVKLIFRCYISPKSIRKWTRRFLDTLPSSYFPIKPQENAFLICHADEKFIKVNGKTAYLWSVIDGAGNWITSIITPNRDKESARKLYNQLKQIYKKIDRIITDGYPAYKKLNTIFGLKCKHIIAGLNKKLFNHNGGLLCLTNNKVECLNSHLEMYLSRFRHHFTNLESANAYIKGYMFITQLLCSFQLQHNLQQPSITEIRQTLTREVENVEQ